MRLKGFYKYAAGGFAAMNPYYRESVSTFN